MTSYLHYVFFFSSRRRHTRSLCDWSSDVCSSDLTSQKSVIEAGLIAGLALRGGHVSFAVEVDPARGASAEPVRKACEDRSEERRVGKEGRSRWAPYH